MQEIEDDGFRQIVETFRRRKEKLKAERQAATDPLNLMRFFPFREFLCESRVHLAESLRELADWVEESE